MMLIRGDKLNAVQKRQVLRAFVHRLTYENAYRAPCRYPQTDQQWLREHAFYFRNDGMLSISRRYAMPASLGELKEY